MQSDPSGRGSVQSVKADSSRNGTQHGSTGPHEASGHAHGEADRASPIHIQPSYVWGSSGVRLTPGRLGDELWRRPLGAVCP